MLQDMNRRFSLKEQYIEIVVEEIDQGRIDRIAERIYGSMTYTWIIAKFASLKTLDQRLPVGMSLRLPSLANIYKALRKERTSAIPVFEYIATQEELDKLWKGVSEENATGGGGNAAFDLVAGETIFKGQPIITANDGRGMLAINDGTNYKVIGLAQQDIQVNDEFSYLVSGQLTIDNWSALLNDGDPEPTTGDLIWLAETGAGKLTTITPQTPNKHAIRIGTMQTPSVLFINLGQPIGL